MPVLITTLGPLSAPESGIILPHEHVFVDQRKLDQPGHGQAETQDVVALMRPELERARAAGVAVIIECTPVGVGRRADILLAVSQAARFPLVVPTGIYREPWVPAWAQQASEEELYTWMLSELTGEIEGSGVQAGFIKLSAGDDGLTACESKILRAAVRAAHATNAVIGSHTIRGRVVRDQLDILAAQALPAERFIWIHAQVEPDFNLNLEMARRGAWIEYDAIGTSPEMDQRIQERILRLYAAGLEDQILLSHDRGWYDPAQPGGELSQRGGVPRPFTALSEAFMPRLRLAGLAQAVLQKLTLENPFRAFAR